MHLWIFGGGDFVSVMYGNICGQLDGGQWLNDVEDRLNDSTGFIGDELKAVNRIALGFCFLIVMIA